MPVAARLERNEFVTDAVHVSISEYRCYSRPADIGRHREDWAVRISMLYGHVETSVENVSQGGQ